MKKIFFLAILAIGMLPQFHIANAQDSKTLGRASEVFPYPFKDLYFISPRFDRQNLKDGGYFNSYILRGVATFNNDYHLRLDIPTASTNLGGGTTFGLSDIDIRFVHAIMSHNKQLYVGYSVQAVFPTATEDVLGSQKWQLRPGLGMMFFRDNLAGTYSFAAEYRFSYAGNSNAPDISVLAISPNIDWWFKHWYIGYYATWTYDFENDMFDIPLDIEVGYTILPNLTLSAEYIQPLLEKRSYNNEFALKLRYNFTFK